MPLFIDHNDSLIYNNFLQQKDKVKKKKILFNSLCQLDFRGKK